MAIDIRANVICSLGKVIQGAISDDSVSPGQGLIACSGQVVIDGLITPSSGTKVELAYVRDGIITRIPRVMRVISSFADPFRNLTTVQLGDKLVWLNEKAPNAEAAGLSPNFPSDPLPGDTYVDIKPYPIGDSGLPNSSATVTYVYNGICWQPEDEDETNGFDLSSPRVSYAEQTPGRPIDETLRRPVAISARAIALKCLAGLSLSSNGISLLSSYYTLEDAQITGSYVSTLETLLGNEGLFGFLDANEVLRVSSIDPTEPISGIYLDENNIIDIGPIGEGILPPELFEITFNLQNLSSPSDPGPYDPDSPGGVAPTLPLASNFRFGAAAPGETFTIPYTTFRANSRYDFYRDQLNKINFNVSAGSNCSIVKENFGITVTVDEGATGNGTLTYTVSDGTNQSNSAAVYFAITETPPSEDPTTGGPVAPGSLTGSVDEYNQKARDNTTGAKDGIGNNELDTSQAARIVSTTQTVLRNILIDYNPPYSSEDVRETKSYGNYSDTFRESYTGYLGESLYEIEIKNEPGAGAASSVFQLWLEAGKNPPNTNAQKITTTTNYYNYYQKITTTKTPIDEADSESGGGSLLDTTDSPQAKSCTIGGICAGGINVPQNPSIGEEFSFGECNYIYNGLTWNKGGTGGTNSQNPKIPTTSSYARFTSSSGIRVEEKREKPTATLYHSIVKNYEDGYYVCGGIQFPEARIFDPLTGLDEKFPPPLIDGLFLTGITETWYEKSYLETGAVINKTYTFEYESFYRTSEGQHYMSEQSKSYEKWLSKVGAIDAQVGAYHDIQHVYKCIGLVQTSASVSETVELPLQAATEEEVPRVKPSSSPARRYNSGNTFDDLTTEQKNKILNKFDKNEYDPSLSLDDVKTQQASFAAFQELAQEWREKNSLTFEQKIAEIERFVAFGSRYGLSLQVAPWSLPSYPLSPIYINMQSVVGSFRSNGISIAFSPSGIVANCDALLVGGVGGTGIPWFPLPEETTLPEAPAPTINEVSLPANSINAPEAFDPANPGEIFESIPATDEDVFEVSLDPTGIVPSIKIQYQIFLGIRTGLVATSIPWSLATQTTDVAVGIKVGIFTKKQYNIRPPAASIGVATIIPKISGGKSIDIGSSNVELAIAAPVVSTGTKVTVPTADITVAPAPGPIVPRISTVVNIPLSNITIDSYIPVVSSGGSTIVPLATITIAGCDPSVSIQAQVLADYFSSSSGQNYGWIADAMPDWWGN